MGPAAGYFYDGLSAARRDVLVSLSAFGLDIRDLAGGRVALWDCQDLNWVEPPEAGGPLRLCCGEEDEARLYLTSADLLEDLIEFAPQLQVRRHRQTGLGRATTYGLVGAACLVLLLVVGLPWLAGQAARVIPISWEEALGERTMGDLETILGAAFDQPITWCESDDGTQVLDDLVARLTVDDESGYRYRVGVLDLDMVNAFALPGGHIVLFRGLIDKAGSSEEVAGILAHEMAHVTQRHGTQAMLRNLSYQLFLELIFDDPSGGTLGGLGALLSHFSYSRDAEAEADHKALARLQAADISPQGLAEFFGRLKEQQGGPQGAFALLSTHPSHGSREALFIEAGEDGSAAMDDAAWQQLRVICGVREEEEEPSAE